MVRLSSHDASVLMDVLEQQELGQDERRQLLVGAAPVVQEIGEALIDPTFKSDDPDVEEAIESIKKWAHETEKIEEEQHLNA